MRECQVSRPGILNGVPTNSAIVYDMREGRVDAVTTALHRRIAELERRLDAYAIASGLAAGSESGGEMASTPSDSPFAVPVASSEV